MYHEESLSHHLPACIYALPHHKLSMHCRLALQAGFGNMGWQMVGPTDTAAAVNKGGQEAELVGSIAVATASPKECIFAG